MYIYRKKSLQGTGSCNYGGWDTQGSVIGKLETPDSKLRPKAWGLREPMEVRVQKPAAGSSSKKSSCFRMSLQSAKDWCSSSRQVSSRRNSFLLLWGQCFFFFFLFRLSTDLTRATHIKAGNPFYSVSYWFKCEFHPKYPHRYTENNAWPSIWTLCGSVKLTCKVNDH